MLTSESQNKAVRRTPWFSQATSNQGTSCFSLARSWSVKSHRHMLHCIAEFLGSREGWISRSPDDQLVSHEGKRRQLQWKRTSKARTSLLPFEQKVKLSSIPVATNLYTTRYLEKGCTVHGNACSTRSGHPWSQPTFKVDVWENRIQQYFPSVLDNGIWEPDHVSSPADYKIMLISGHLFPLISRNPVSYMEYIYKISTIRLKATACASKIQSLAN